MAITVKSIDKNHDWDFAVDEAGNITELVIVAEINYGSMGSIAQKDIWTSLTDAQKAQMQTIYNKTKEWYAKQFVWELVPDMMRT